MRSHPKVTPGVLFGMFLCLVVTASAQKGKPEPAPRYTWEATISDETDNNVYGPGVLHRGPVTASAIYTPPSSTSPGRSSFLVRMEGGDVSQGDWIGFRGLALAGTTGSPFCNFPVFGADGIINPYTKVGDTPACIADFASHRFPQWPYVRWSFQLVVPNVDFDAVVPGSSVVTHLGRLSLVIESADWATWSAIGNGTGDYSEGPVTINRIDADNWETAVFLPLALTEKAVVPARKGTQVVTAAISITKPITARIRWTRSRVP